MRNLFGSTGVTTAVPPRSREITLLDRLIYLVALLSVWSITGRYWGIQHDALGYMLQAAARLDPQPLAGDIFLRYRSQDDFTVFPSFAAFAIDWLGVDRAGSILTFGFLVAWLLGAAFLLRRVQGSTLTWLSTGLLLVLPGWYSAGEVFRYAEPFFTARTLAEALSLWAIFAALASQPVAAALLLCAGLAVHPLMAFPATLLVIAHALPLTNWKRYAAFLGTLVASALLGSFVLSWKEPFITGDWLEITRWRSRFLFVGAWNASDREVAAQTLLTLTLTALVLPEGGARRLVRASLLVGIAGLVLALIASEWLPLRVLMQGQAWRWTWIGRFFATALLPLTLLTLWMRGGAARPAALLLACAWLLTNAGSFKDVPPVGVGGLLCALSISLWLTREKLSAGAMRVTGWLAWLIVFVVGVSFVSVLVIASGNDFEFGYDPAWVQRVSDVLYTPGIAALVVVAAWAYSFVANSRVATTGIAIAAVALMLGSAPEALASWLRTPFDAKQRATFSEWRSLIPEDSEVLWHQAPQAVWFLLDRRSYLTVSQAAGTVFSLETTQEIARRAESLSALVAPGVWYLDPSAKFEEFQELTASVLRDICRDRSLGFVVAAVDLGTQVASAEWPGKGDFVYLYDCSVEREHAAK